MGNQLGLRLLAQPGRRDRLRLDGPHRAGRARRGGGVLGHHVPHLVEPRAVGSTSSAVRELIAPDAGPVLRLDGRDRAREHPQLRRRHDPATRRRSPRCVELARDARPGPAPGRRPDLERARRDRHAAARARRPVSTPCRSACRRGSGAPVGSVLVVERRTHRRGPGLAQALRRRHAPGRHPGRRRPLRARPQPRPGWPMTTRGRSGSRPSSAATRPTCDDQHRGGRRCRRRRGRGGRRARAGRAAQRARARAAAAGRRTWTSTTTASTTPSRCCAR